MATFKDELKALAPELIDGEFESLRYPLVFSITTGGLFNPVTGQTTGGTNTTYSYQAIPKEMDIEQWQGFDIAVTDLPVVYTRIDNFKPSVEQTCTFKGVLYQVRGAKYDEAADATVKLVLRAL